MQFENLNNKTTVLFDQALSPTEKEKIINEMKTNSPGDLEFLNQTATALTPSTGIKASKALKQNVMEKIHESSNSTFGKPGKTITLLMPTWKKIASIAAILLVSLAIVPIFGQQLFNPNAKAMSLLNTSIEAISNIKYMNISFQVRSIPGDNLDLIDTKGDFIDYKLWKEFAPAEKWRIEKPGLTVVMDGENQYKFMEKAGIGFVGSTKARFVDWMKMLLDPQKILQNEKTFASKHKAEYKIDKTNTETLLTISAKAQGDFKNPYLLNSSIPESNNRRVYHFDKTTNRLTALEVYVTENKTEILVLKLKSVEYNEVIEPETFKITLPEGTKWVQLKEIEPNTQNATAAKNPEEAANLFFESLAKKDWETVYKLFPSIEQSSNVENIKQEYAGLHIISIGKPFKSGMYAGQFVPYEIQLKSGETQSENLAVRNDNTDKIWQIDGGF